MLPILEVPAIRRQAAPISVETYHAMAAHGMVEEKTELLRGVIVEKVSKSPLHVYLVRKLHQLAELAAGDRFLIRKEEPLTFVDSEPEPDVAVVEGEESQFRHVHPRTAWLVMEVAISSVDIDREKGTLYAEAGIPEFWLVLPEQKQIEVATHPENGIYTKRQVFSPGAILTSVTLPTLQVDLAGLFAD